MLDYFFFFGGGKVLEKGGGESRSICVRATETVRVSFERRVQVFK